LEVVILFPFGKEKVTAHQAKAAWIQQPNLLPIERERIKGLIIICLETFSDYRENWNR
jgi:hypothetical protein